jgi:alanine dehydrogenase
MIVGVPRELKASERRVALTPDAVRALVLAGSPVLVEASAGAGSGFSDAEYVAAGARVVALPDELFQSAELIVKVKEPQPVEFERLRAGQIVFGYFHLAAAEDLTRACLKAGITGLAFETLEAANGSLPMLAPMSAIAGRLAIQAGARFLEGPSGGSGILLGGVPGVSPGKVVILGGGVVGEHAARIAAGMGAEVSLLDVNFERLQQLSVALPANVRTVFSSSATIARLAADADLLVGAVLVRGRRAPHLITREILRSMRPGSVFVDVCVDQGGAAETTRPTTHDAPTFVEEGVLHYCVPNMPGAVPRTSTLALSSVILPYVLDLARGGLSEFLSRSRGHALALNTRAGHIANPDVAATFPHLPYQSDWHKLAD